MAENRQNPPVIDPDSVPEMLCDGQFNVSIGGPLAMLTFTQVRPDATALFNGTIDAKSVVRARIVLPINNLAALRDLLNRIIQEPGTPVASAGGIRH
jgi:hypothetical protein